MTDEPMQPRFSFGDHVRIRQPNTPLDGKTGVIVNSGTVSDSTGKVVWFQHGVKLDNSSDTELVPCLESQLSPVDE